MLYSRTSLPSAFWRAVLDKLMAPVSPRNLRLSAILIGIYKLLVAHVLLFLVLLGLAHAEQMKTMLALDIEDQKENGFYNMSPFRNQLRLRTASQLVSITEMMLYIFTFVSLVYLLSTIALFVGIFRNRAELILPWLVLEFVGLIGSVVVVIWFQNEKLVELIGGKIYYFCFCFNVIFFNFLMWYIIHSFYQSLRTMNKLREIATVAIPCPPPEAIPFHFRRENMYLGSNGYKHILSEAPDGNY